MAIYAGKQTVWVYDRTNRDTGVKAQQVSADRAIADYRGQQAASMNGCAYGGVTSRVALTSGGGHRTSDRTYGSTRSVAWQLAEYELNMLGPVPRGMEKMASDYARHFAGMRVSA